MYLRERDLLPHLDAWLGRLFDPDNVDKTCEAMLVAATANASNDAERAAVNEALRACDQKLDRYRQLLETGADAALVAGWINDVQAERRQLESRLRSLSAESAADFATADEIRRVVEELGGMVGLLKDTQPKLRSRFYEEVGLTATLDPLTRSVEASADLGVRMGGVGGGT